MVAGLKSTLSVNINFHPVAALQFSLRSFPSYRNCDWHYYNRDNNFINYDQQVSRSASVIYSRFIGS